MRYASQTKLPGQRFQKRPTHTTATAPVEVKTPPPSVPSFVLLDGDEGTLDRETLTYADGRLWEQGAELIKNIMIGPRPVKLYKSFPERTESIQWLGAKIPKTLSDQVLSWCKHWVDKGECQGKLFYHKRENKWLFEVFPQLTPRGMTTDEKPDDPRHDELQAEITKKGYTCFGSIHHHCDISAFQSGTDQKDEDRFNGVHVTFGKLKDKAADIHIRVVHEGTTYSDIPTEVFFEDTELSLENLPAYPKEWDERFVERPVAFPHKTCNTTHGYGHSWSTGYCSWLDDDEDFDFSIKAARKAREPDDGESGYVVESTDLSYYNCEDLLILDMLAAEFILKMADRKEWLFDFAGTCKAMRMTIQSDPEAYVSEQFHGLIDDEMISEVAEIVTHITKLKPYNKTLQPLYISEDTDDENVEAYLSTWSKVEKELFDSDIHERLNMLHFIKQLSFD